MLPYPLRTWAEIDLAALRHNLTVLRSTVPPDVGVVGVVKADAYGHGAVAVARCLRAEGVAVFAVASVEEAAELREAGFTAPLWHLGVPLPAEAEALIALRVTPTALTHELIDALAAASPAPLEVHLKLDTGMGRRGGGLAETRALWDHCRATGRLTVTALTTHFATADCDVPFAREQADRFAVWRDELAAAGYRVPRVHLASGAAALALAPAPGDWLRPGLALYGLADDARLRPVMALRSRLCQVRELPAGHEVGYAHGCRLAAPTRVGLVPVGYGDGWPWRLSGGAAALVGGRRVPYLGRVNMDLIQLDLNNVPTARVGDVVTLVGPDGAQRLDAAEVAAWAGTSVYTVPTCLTRRVTRQYRDHGEVVAVRGLDGVLRDVATRRT